MNDILGMKYYKDIAFKLFDHQINSQREGVNTHAREGKPVERQRPVQTTCF